MVIGDILEDQGKQVEAEINESGGECLFVRRDVTSETQWEQAGEAAVSWFGKLNVLVNNAGIRHTQSSSFASASIEITTEEQWDRIMEVNAKGVFLGTKARYTGDAQSGRRPPLLTYRQS